MSDDLFEWARRHQISTHAVMELMDMMDPTRLTTSSSGELSSEQAVQSGIRLRAASLGIPLWRNNSGVLKDERGVPVRFGLANDSAKVNKQFKSPDLVGIWPMEIKPEHVGKVVGRFAGIECKRPGWKGPKTDKEAGQSRFLQHVNALGGVGMFAQSVKDVFPDDL